MTPRWITKVGMTLALAVVAGAQAHAQNAAVIEMKADRTFSAALRVSPEMQATSSLQGAVPSPTEMATGHADANLPLGQKYLPDAMASVPTTQALHTAALQPNSATTASVVISQVYGGGGGTTAGAPYANDFVELFNNTTSSVDLSNYSLQYSSASSTSTFGVFKFTSGTSIGAGKYFFIEGGNSGGTVGALLPTGFTPDANFSGLDISNSAAELALVSNQTALSGATTGNANTIFPGKGVVDFVGIGSANRYETTATAAYDRSTSVQRNYTNTGYVDTDNNFNDFIVAAPVLRNSSTQFSPAPEPSSLVSVIVGMGLLGLIVARRRIRPLPKINKNLTLA